MSSLSQSDILDFIRSSPAPVTKREIARAFGIKGGERRVAMKQILKQLEKDGVIAKQAGGAFSVPQGLPAVGVIEVSDIDIDGDVFARSQDWNEEAMGAPPRIEVMPAKKGHPALKVGDRALARFSRVGANEYEARIIRNLDTPQNKVLGMLNIQKRGAILQPTDKKAKYDFDVIMEDLKGAEDGDLVIGEIQPERGVRNKKVRIAEVIGKRDDPKAISLISSYETGLRMEFPSAAIKETKNQKVPPMKGRTDLRDIPLVTIDGADARDFDDAVFAEKCTLPKGGDGYHLIVAIADVSYYVRPGSALDLEAQARGNSTYFPDRVIPMLPEALSNDLCSLRPHEPRACLAMHMWIDMDGRLVRHEIVRGIMRSAARLIYEDVQQLYDQTKASSRPKRSEVEGSPDNYGDPSTTDAHAPSAQDDEMFLKPLIQNLYEAFHILDAARQKRGALDLDLPERQIIIDENNNMTGVKQRTRVDAHKVIEEFMILANVAAAKALEAKEAPCVYRVHDSPSMEKIDSAREFISSFGLSLPKGQRVEGRQLNGVLRQAAKLPYSHLISTVILRSQSQAVYACDNIGHFGLALSKYAHFTSPIRRYADLLVHRSLIRAYKLGPGGLNDEQEVRLDEICQDISGCERKSMEAERNAVDRFTAAFLSEQIGATFPGKISGVTRFGLFVTLDESGADGLVPMKSMADDFYVHDEEAHALVGRRRGKIYRLGAEVTVRLKEADGLTGSTVLELVGPSLKGADVPGMKKPGTASHRKKKPTSRPPARRPGKPGGKPKTPPRAKKSSYKKKK